ncbi:MAG: hypothetical protein KDB27_32715, partial [Planctomycetales bacterium]|nr:hypothetical protein [Planctomycetales bacterium]
DLMGLRWAPSVVDLNHLSVRDAEHVVRGRRMSVEGSVYDITTRTVDDILGMETDTPEHLRPDLYHRQRQPSPYHPGGYTYQKMNDDDDPAGQGFEHRDRRPVELREPLYDPKHRTPIRMEVMSDVPVSDGQVIYSTPPVTDGSGAFSPEESVSPGNVAPVPMELADPYRR